MPEGVFIVIEGIDGAGSTTQALRLERWCRARVIDVLRTREPTDGAVGRLLRSVLRGEGEWFGAPPRWDAMALLFAADRLLHLQREIEPALRRGAVVVTDRYDLSSVAYQSATAGSDAAEGVAWVRTVNAHARRPDATIVIDVTADEAHRRRDARGGEAELFEREELQRRLVERYDDARSLVPGDALAHVDGSGTPQQVFDRILAALHKLLGRRFADLTTAPPTGGWLEPDGVTWSRWLLDSFRRRTGRELIERSGRAVEDARRLRDLEAVVLSHPGGTDPRFCYGNIAALRRFELSWHELLRTPSRLSAEPDAREERAAALAAALRDGVYEGYEGVRVSSTGVRFHVRGATLWSVDDDDGATVGQAATFTLAQDLSD